MDLKKKKLSEHTKKKKNTTDNAILIEIFGTANGATRNMWCKKSQYTNAPLQ